MQKTERRSNWRKTEKKRYIKEKLEVKVNRGKSRSKGKWQKTERKENGGKLTRKGK
jgi:hypothetical protein